MRHYRVYRVNGAGGIEAAEWIDAQNDDQAVQMAFELGDWSRCEVWEQNRLVGSLTNDADRQQA
jgi:hypothetical protein